MKCKVFLQAVQVGRVPGIAVRLSMENRTDGAGAQVLVCKVT